MNIAQRYLIPRQLEQTGLADNQMTIAEPALAQVIRRYTREAGVRELERTIGRLCRKVATQFATGQTAPVTVKPENLKDLLGGEKFFQEDAAGICRPAWRRDWLIRRPAAKCSMWKRCF